MNLSDIELRGKLAGAMGESLDSCPYRRGDRRNAWVRGWQEGRAQEERRAVAYSDQEIARAKDKLAALRKMLKP